MRKNRKPAVLNGIGFGFVCFAICVFFVTPQMSLLLGIFTAASYILVLSIIVDVQARKYSVDNDRDDAVLMDSANFYRNSKPICNGNLYLTVNELVFVSKEKKNVIKEIVPIATIKTATYGVLLGHIAGLKIFMDDDTSFGFVVNKPERYIEKITSMINALHHNET